MNPFGIGQDMHGIKQCSKQGYDCKKHGIQQQASPEIFGLKILCKYAAKD
jgi:hypothetical protein